MQYGRLQELEHVRELLQVQLSRTSGLEGENRQLKRQLAELKQELRADKAAVEAQLQSLHGEVLRHKLAADQALVAKQREQEHSATLQQQADGLRARLAKGEREREALQAQAASLSSEGRALHAQLGEAEKEKAALAEQLAAATARAEEVLRCERAQHQAAAAANRALLEQNKNELCRWERRKGWCWRRNPQRCACASTQRLRPLSLPSLSPSLSLSLFLCVCVCLSHYCNRLRLLAGPPGSTTSWTRSAGALQPPPTRPRWTPRRATCSCRSASASFTS